MLHLLSTNLPQIAPYLAGHPNLYAKSRKDTFYGDDVRATLTPFPVKFCGSSRTVGAAVKQLRGPARPGIIHTYLLWRRSMLEFCVLLARLAKSRMWQT